MRLLPGDVRGNVVRDPHHRRPIPRLVRNASRGMARAAFTFTAVVCNDAAVQENLPQLMVLSKKLLRKRELQLLEETLPRNVYVVAADSAWMTTHLTCQFVKLIGKVLATSRRGRDVILSMDAAKVHLGQEVVAACTQACMRYLLVPAKMAWLLQPCDTHVFQRLKRALQCAPSDRALTHTNGQTPRLEQMQMLAQTANAVLTGHAWRGAFLADGLLGAQRGVSETIRRTVPHASSQVLPHSAPSAEMLATLFPARQRVPYGSLFRNMRAWGEAESHTGAACGTHAEQYLSAPLADRPWLGRTRSSSQLGGRGSAQSATPEVSTGAAAGREPEASQEAGSSLPWRQGAAQTVALTASTGQSSTAVVKRLPQSRRPQTDPAKKTAPLVARSTRARWRSASLS